MAFTPHLLLPRWTNVHGVMLLLPSVLEVMLLLLFASRCRPSCTR